MKDTGVSVRSKWRIVRQDYDRLTKICYLVNEKFSGFIIVSFFTNIYYMIFHIYRTLSVDYSQLEFAYFILSFGLLIVRVTCICWVGGLLYQETAGPLSILISTSPEVYNVEVINLNKLL